MALNKTQKRVRVKKRVRKNIFGTSQKPRLSVYKSNKEIYAQVIDDVTGVTISSATSRLKEIDTKGNKSDIAKNVGIKVAELAKSAGIDTVVFDRNGFVYHGRVKALADGAREGGLKF
jgi:large subunit ribosomal protein L18